MSIRLSNILAASVVFSLITFVFFISCFVTSSPGLDYDDLGPFSPPGSSSNRPQLHNRYNTQPVLGVENIFRFSYLYLQVFFLFL